MHPERLKLRFSPSGPSLVIAVMLGVLSGCSRPAASTAENPSSTTPTTTPATMKRYHLQGVVLSKATRSQELVVRHGAIAGLMQPMTMIYKVQDAAAFARLKPGDQISSDVLTTGFDDKLFLENIVVTAEPRSAHEPVPLR